ncbi:hypothetical protein [Streptomyces sp. NPDC001450]
MTRVMLDVSDISDAQQLIRYALAAELDLLAEDHQITQVAVARALGKDRSYLTHALEGHPKNLSSEQLRDLDETFVALAPAVGETGGLSSLNMRLRGLSDSTLYVSMTTTLNAS